MKLDLNKPWIMRLVNQNSTVNGCSFIRGVILRTIWSAFLWVGGVALGSLVCMVLIGGAYIWITNPAFMAKGFPDRMTYFGTDWVSWTWALLTYIGGVLWGGIAIIGSVLGCFWLLMKGLEKSSVTIGSVSNKVWKAITPSEPFQEAVSAWYHKFCPEIEIILPKGYEGYVVGARVADNYQQWDDEGDKMVDFWRPGTIVQVTLDSNRLELEIMWDMVRDSINEHFAQQFVIDEYESPEELEAARLYSMRVRTGDHRLWFNSSNEDFKLLVEENDSPQ